MYNAHAPSVQHMRKFVIKNRQKRKYTKKSEELSSFSFSKTAYNMVPLMVMVIAFMSTMIISAPIRDAFTNISFTFELPKFSITNPLSFFQTLIADLSQVGIIVWSVLQSFADAISQSFVTIESDVSSGTVLLNNFLVLCNTIISNCSFFALQETLKGVSLLGLFFSFIFLTVSFILHNCVSAVAYFAIATGQVISTTAQFVMQQILVVIGISLHFLLTAVVMIGNVIIFILRTVLSIIVSAVTFVGTLIARIFLAIVHVIEIPFKVLYAFWLLIKPYVVIFDKHLQMSGSDFSNMFDSINKLAALTSRAK